MALSYLFCNFCYSVHFVSDLATTVHDHHSNFHPYKKIKNQNFLFQIEDHTTWIYTSVMLQDETHLIFVLDLL